MNESLHHDTDGNLKESDSPDHFAFFGLKRSLDLDEKALETDYFALSRRFHPDFFVSKSLDQQILSLEKTSALNNAYRVLRDSVSRAEYLIELETGHAFGESGEARQVPMELLGDVMDIRERIMDLAMADDDEKEALLTALRADRTWAQEMQATADAKLAKLAASWDARFAQSDETDGRSALVGEIKDELSQRRYFSGLIRDIDKVLV